MPTIVTTSELQKSIGKLTTYVQKSWVIITKRGKPSAVMIPYDENQDSLLADIYEQREMEQSATVLRKRYNQSKKSGRSTLRV